MVSLRISLARTTRQSTVLNFGHELFPQVHHKCRVQVVREPVLPTRSNVELHHQAPSRGRGSGAVVDVVDGASNRIVEASQSARSCESDDLIDDGVPNVGVQEPFSQSKQLGQHRVHTSLSRIQRRLGCRRQSFAVTVVKILRDNLGLLIREVHGTRLALDPLSL
jgi:hypothetical protein